MKPELSWSIKSLIALPNSLNYHLQNVHLKVESPYVLVIERVYQSISMN